MFSPESSRICRPSSTFVPLILTTTGMSTSTSLAAATMPRAATSQRKNAAEDVDQHLLHFGVRDKELEGLGDFLFIGAAAHVQKVGRSSPEKLDNVHGPHRRDPPH